MRFAPVVFATLCMLGSLIAEEPAPRLPVAELAKLIQSLPPQEDIKSPRLKELNEAERADFLERAVVGYNELYQQLRRGASVFDYPGLLALTRVVHSTRDGDQQIRVGVPYFHQRDPQDRLRQYVITFDRQGIILEIRPLLGWADLL